MIVIDRTLEEFINLFLIGMSMKTLQWKSCDWKGSKYNVMENDKNVSTLHFDGAWNFDAIYIGETTQLKFSETGFWKPVVQVKINDEVIGDIRPEGSFSRNQTLVLKSGKTYRYNSDSWAKAAAWREDGNSIIDYTFSQWKSKGSIRINQEIDPQLLDTLVGAGLYLNQLTAKKSAIFVVIFIPLLVSITQ
jgi:hypothetical protein